MSLDVKTIAMRVRERREGFRASVEQALNIRSSRIRSVLPRRAALAHELCHLLYDGGEGDLTTQLSWGQDHQTASGAIEQRARSFAPAFLAPPDEVRHWFRAGDGKHFRKAETKVLALSKHWGLSLEGAIWHAKNCGLIQSGSAKKLAESWRLDRARIAGSIEWSDSFESKSSYRAESTRGVDCSPLAKGSIERLVHEAAEAGAISEGRAKEILAWG